MPDLPAYGAVVLYYRHGRDVSATISSLDRQSHRPANIVLVDNNSEDGVIDTLQMEGSLPANLLIVTLSTNVGYAGGMNTGFDQLPPNLPYVLFMTHELLLESTAVAHLTALASDEKAAIVGPSLTLPGGGVWSSGGYFRRGGAAIHSSTAIAGRFRESEWLDGSCLLMDSESFKAVGKFNESYFLYWEDADLCARLRETGRVLCSGLARAQQSTQSAPIYFNTCNRLRYWRLRRDPLNVIYSVVESLARLVIRDLASSERSTRTKARFLGIRDGLSLRPARRNIFTREQS